MSIFLQLTWPIVDLKAVCNQQSRSGAGDLAFNGTLYNSTTIPDQVSFIANDMIRSVSITGNASGVNFTITGFQNGALVTEMIPGPSGGTAHGTKYYDIIKSVSTSNTVSNIDVGTDTSGYLPLIVVNPNTTAINYSFSLLLKTGTIDYTMYETLDSINTNFIPFSNQTLFEFPGVANLSASTLKNSTAITNFLLLKINSSVNATSFDFVFLQE